MTEKEIKDLQKLSDDELTIMLVEEQALLITRRKHAETVSGAIGIAKAQTLVNNSVIKINTIESILQERAESGGAASEAKWEESKERVAELIEVLNMGYLTRHSRLWYCEGKTDAPQVNPRMYEISCQPKPVVDFFRTKHKEMYGTKDIPGITEERVRDLLIDMNRSYSADTVVSCNEEKWPSHLYLNQMSVIRKYWAKPKKAKTSYVSLDGKTEQNHDPRIDFLLYCVGGGKKENIQHLKKWILMKHKHPEKSVNIPNIDIGGGKGGSGKGALVKILKTIFTNVCVVPTDVSDLLKFNGVWGMAVIVYFDEGDVKEMPHNALKRVTAAEERRDERKGKDATIVDDVTNKLFMSNNDNGVVPLVGGEAGEDRRFSIIFTGTQMVPTAKSMFNFETMTQAKLFVNSCWEEVFGNREKISEFLYSLYEEFPDLDHLEELHGEDYRRRVNKQKPDIVKAFDIALPLVKEHGVIAQEWLGDIVRKLTDNASWKDKNVTDEFERYLERQSITYEVKERTKITLGPNLEVQPKAIRLTGEYEKKPYTFAFMDFFPEGYHEWKKTDKMNRHHFVEINDRFYESDNDEEVENRKEMTENVNVADKNQQKKADLLKLARAAND